MAKDVTLVTIRTYLNNFDAEIDRLTLEAAGINSMIRSDDCGGLRPHLWMGGVELLVRDDQARQAVDVLTSRVDPPADAELAGPPDEDPSGG